MARKRMIKPEFWTDSTMVLLPAEARLLFIGMWNFADDYGYIEDEPDRLALQILPADDADVDLLLDLLIASGRVERYRAPDGTYFLFIPHFAAHQKVDHPAKPTYPNVTECTKQSIPPHVRRQVAIKYGCQPGERSDAACYYCGAIGSIYWPRTRKGQPGAWVAFSGLELDHLVPESDGGETESGNIVLACRTCNRSKHTLDGVTFSELGAAFSREYSREFVSTPKSSPQVKLSQVKLDQTTAVVGTGVSQESRSHPVPSPSKPATTVVSALIDLGLFRSQAIGLAKKNPSLDVAGVLRWGEWVAASKSDNPIALMVKHLKEGRSLPPATHSNTNGKHGRPTQAEQPDLHIAVDEFGNEYLALADGKPYEVPA